MSSVGKRPWWRFRWWHLPIWLFLVLGLPLLAVMVWHWTGMDLWAVEAKARELGIRLERDAWLPPARECADPEALARLDACWPDPEQLAGMLRTPDPADLAIASTGTWLAIDEAVMAIGWRPAVDPSGDFHEGLQRRFAWQEILCVRLQLNDPGAPIDRCATTALMAIAQSGHHINQSTGDAGNLGRFMHKARQVLPRFRDLPLAERKAFADLLRERVAVAVRAAPERSTDKLQYLHHAMRRDPARWEWMCDRLGSGSWPVALRGLGRHDVLLRACQGIADLRLAARRAEILDAARVTDAVLAGWEQDGSASMHWPGGWLYRWFCPDLGNPNAHRHVALVLEAECFIAAMRDGRFPDDPWKPPGTPLQALVIKGHIVGVSSGSPSGRNWAWNFARMMDDHQSEVTAPWAPPATAAEAERLGLNLP